MTRSQPHRVLPARPPPSAGQGLAEAFIRLHAALLPAVRDYLASLDGSMDYHWREDLVQEVFFRAWKNLGCFRGEASVKTFVFTIAKRVLREERLRHAKLPFAYPGDFDQIPGSYVSDGSRAELALKHIELSQTIEQAKARLPEAQRQALELKHLHHLPIREIAKFAGCGYGQFRDRLYRARKRLRQLLKDLPLCILL